MSSTTPTSTPRSPRTSHSRLIPSRGLVVRVLVFAAAVLLVAVIQGAVFLGSGSPGYDASPGARPAPMRSSSGTT